MKTYIIRLDLTVDLGIEGVYTLGISSAVAVLVVALNFSIIGTI